MQAGLTSALKRGGDEILKLVGLRPKIEIIAASAITTALLAVYQLSTGAHFFSVLYASLVAVVAWFVSLPAALCFAVADTFLILTDGLVLRAQIDVKTTIDLLNLVFSRSIVFFVVAFVFSHLKYVQSNIEKLAEARAEALARETYARQRLEHEMLDISEREQRRIGRDLHDGLCQLLTAAALSNITLLRALKGKHEIESADMAKKTSSLIEDAISLARSTAKGLDPVELRSDGLMQAFEEFCATTSDLFGVQCQFSCGQPVFIESATTATHLYRIAQEAVGNAVKHGNATQIDIALEDTETGVRLSISDNGQGLTSESTRNRGMGLRTMDVRSKLVRGNFSIGRSKSGGVEVVCQMLEAANAYHR